MDDSLHDFIDTYLENSPLLIDEMEQGLISNDTQAIFHSAHQLKGGSGSIGAMKLTEITLNIEQICKKDSTDGIKPLLLQLKEEFSELKKALKSEL